MTLSCPGIQQATLDGSRWHAGRTGYTGAPVPAAIVLHQLQGMSLEAYFDQLRSPAPRFLCNPDPVTCAYPYTVNPLGVHFGVNDTAMIQFAEIGVTTLGLDYLDGNWPGLAGLAPITDINGPFIHVVVDTCCSDTVQTLLCCIAVYLGTSLPIVSAGDLQTDRPVIILNPSLQTAVDDCFASGGFIEPPTIFDLQDRVEQLEICCFTNTSDIVLLKASDIEQNIRITSLEERMTTVEEKIVDIYDKIAIIPTLVAQVQVLIDQVQDILTRCCPKKNAAVCAHYQLLPGDEMLITPNQAVWLNLPTRIEDRDDPNCTTGCKGPIVKPGPLWMACLDDSCTWSIDATVRFRLGMWCAGKLARLTLVACGKKYVIAEQVITSTGTQAITLTGNFILPGGCCDVHLLVFTDDDKIASAKVVEFADFKACCVS